MHSQKSDLSRSMVLTFYRLTDVLPTGDAEQDALDKKRYLNPNPRPKAQSNPSDSRRPLHAFCTLRN